MVVLCNPQCSALPSTSQFAVAQPIMASILHWPTAAKTRHLSDWASGFRSKSFRFVLSTSLALGLSLTGVGFAEAKAGVNKPELLPKEFSPVIDVGGFLSAGQEKRLAQEIADLERDTGFKLRLIAQSYPETPGLAIKEFWQVDDRTIVLVADPTFGNMLNFNVGDAVDADIPRSFWSRVAGKYGNVFYWKEKGEDASIEAAVMVISKCLRGPLVQNSCSEVRRDNRFLVKCWKFWMESFPKVPNMSQMEAIFPNQGSLKLKKVATMIDFG